MPSNPGFSFWIGFAIEIYKMVQKIIPDPLFLLISHKNVIPILLPTFPLPADFQNGGAWPINMRLVFYWNKQQKLNENG